MKVKLARSRKMEHRAVSKPLKRKLNLAAVFALKQSDLQSNRGDVVNSAIPLIDSSTKMSAQQTDEENEKKDDSNVKAKRKRKKKHKEKLKIGEEVIPLRVLSKYDPAAPFSNA